MVHLQFSSREPLMDHHNPKRGITMAFSSRRSVLVALALALAAVGCHGQGLKGADPFPSALLRASRRLPAGGKYQGVKGNAGGGGGSPSAESDESDASAEDPVEDPLTCTGEDEVVCDNDGSPGVMICKKRGNSNMYQSQCVDPADTGDYPDAECGCCDIDIDGTPANCPSEEPEDDPDPAPCDDSNSIQCDGGSGYYMCRAVGQATLDPLAIDTAAPSPSPSKDVLDPLPKGVLDPLPKGVQNLCVEKEDTVDAQINGAACGCCANDDGYVRGASYCPTATCDSATHPCDLVSGDGVTDDGVFVCHYVGNGELRTSCVSEDDSEGMLLKGGACGTCPVATTAGGLLRMRLPATANEDEWEKDDRRALEAEWEQDAREQWEHDEWDKNEQLEDSVLPEVEDVVLGEPPSQLGSQVMEKIAAMKREEWDQDEPWDLEVEPQVQEEAVVDEGEWNQDAQEW